MTRLSIELPDDLGERARSRAAEAGHPSVEAYLRSLLVDDIELGEAVPPPRQHVADLAGLTELVRAGLDSGPAFELTDADWARKRQELVGRHSGRDAS
jgi:plasmid stability protein